MKVRLLCLSILLPATAISEEAKRGDWVRELEERAGSHRLMDHYGYQSHEILRLDVLSKDIPYERGKVSLVLDPKDREAGWIAAFLINDTPEPLKGVVAEFSYCLQEVKVGTHWKRSQPVELGCGNISPSRDLPPQHMWVFPVRDPSIGDLEGEIRYFFGPFSGPMVTKPIKGRFSSVSFDRAAKDYANSRTAGTIAGEIFSEQAGKPLNQSEIARTSEEIIAALHLERAYDESRVAKEAAEAWLATMSGDEAKSQQRKALQELLLLPWEKNFDEPAILRRCLTALAGNGAEEAPYGSPEKCRAMVWRYLDAHYRTGRSHFPNPERQVELDAIRASGNPWGVNQAEACALLKLAAEHFASGPPEESEAAGRFLQGSWIKESHLPEDTVRRLLEIDSPLARRTGLSLLINRGQQKEASAWLAGRHKELGEEMKALLPLAQTYPAPFEAWQTECVLQWMKNDFQQCLSYLLTYSGRNMNGVQAQLPRELRTPIVRFLEDEAVQQRITSSPLPTRDVLGKLREAENGDFFSRIVPLRLAVLVLVQWKDPADDELLKKLSTHPAAYYDVFEGKVARYYEIRSFILATSKENKRAVPVGIVTREDVEIP